MPICQNCENQEFTIESGVYLCSVCHVVSQEAVHEVLDHFQTPHVASASQNTKNYGKVKKKLQDKGKPWYSTEAFQVILKSQINALISLGVTPELREVAKQIWFKYVHKSGIAVIDPSLPSVKKPLEIASSFRDRYLAGNLGKRFLKKELYPNTKNIMSMKIRFPTYTKAGRKRERSSSSFDISGSEKGSKDKQRLKIKKKKLTKNVLKTDKDKAWRSDEEWFSFASGSSSSDEEEILLNPKPMSSSIKSASLQQKLKIQLDLALLISVLHIALHWCNELVTVGNLIQWIRQGVLPFLDSFKCLLPHMKITEFDISHLFYSKQVSYQTIIHTSSQLIDFLEMPENLPDMDIKKLVLRYVLSMNLPFELVAFVHTFMQTTSFEYKRRREAKAPVYAPEAAALSLIIISCKVLFGLNDVQEWKKVEPCSFHDECCVFSWQEWSNYHCKQSVNIRKNPSNCFESTDVEPIEDLHDYIDNFRNIVNCKMFYGKENFCHGMTLKKLKKTAESKTWPFMKLIEAQGSNKKNRNPNINSEPVPTPEDDFSKRCIDPFLKLFENEDCEYVWYTDGVSRVEDCFLLAYDAPRFDFTNISVDQFFPELHLSYDILLTIASRISFIDKLLLHGLVQSFERQYIAPFLVAKKQQRFTTTSWYQSKTYTPRNLHDSRKF